MKSERVFTFGYSGFDIPELLTVLKTNKINAVIDVRSQPYSKYFQNYNQEVIKNVLSKNNIAYKNYANEFGARQLDKRYYYKGYLDFDLFSLSPQFQDGFNKIKEATGSNYVFAFMCAEKDPAECHRANMITKYFYNNGFDVIHLLPNGKTITQADIENSLLQKYFPNRAQMSMFENFDDKELIQKAYQMRNAEIGYREEKGEDF